MGITRTQQIQKNTRARERYNDKHRAGAAVCSECGGQLRLDSIHGICSRRLECEAVRREAKNRKKRLERPRQSCPICGGPLQTNARYEACSRNPVCNAARLARKGGVRRLMGAPD